MIFLLFPAQQTVLSLNNRIRLKAKNAPLHKGAGRDYLIINDYFNLNCLSVNEGYVYSIVNCCTVDEVNSDAIALFCAVCLCSVEVLPLSIGFAAVESYVIISAEILYPLLYVSAGAFVKSRI